NLQLLSNQDMDSGIDIINLDGSITPTGTEGILREALNNLRSQLPEAMVTTYTYDPFIGVTSVTDPRGQVIYYKYDEFNRLENIIDKNGYLLNKNDYRYKTQN